jgi:DNA-directed RNA polymerase omega subunit
MAQEGYDTLMKLIGSRYQLSMIAGRRAAQLKLGTPSTLTQKSIRSDENAVSVAMKELEQGSGVRWGDDLPSRDAIAQQVQRDQRDASAAPPRYSVLKDESREGDKAF